MHHHIISFHVCGSGSRMAENYGGSPESSPHSDNESGGHMYNSNSNNHESSSIREQDRLLPIANVSRIMKKALPANAKISKDAKETVQECVSEFISFITGEASDKCQREKRKTINGDDLLWAMSTLGFEDYVEPLKLYLHKYRELEGEKVSMAKQGEQSSSKDGSTVSSAASGSYNGGIPSVSMMQTAYGQPQGAMVFGQHQMMAPYQLPANSGGSSSSGSGGQGQPRVQW